MITIRQRRLFDQRTDPVRWIRIDYAQSNAVSHAMIQGSTETFVFDGDLGTLEYFVHELGHALSLGIEIKNRFDREIEPRLNLHDDNGHSNEALVLAAESYLFRWLDHPIHRDDFYDLMMFQQTDPRLFEAHMKTFAPLRLAHRLLRWLEDAKILA